MASIDAIREARLVNKRKGDRLLVAFLFFAAALLATLVLGTSVAIRSTDTPKPHG